MKMCKNTGHSLSKAKDTLLGAGKAAVAGATGAALVVGNLVREMPDKVSAFRGESHKQAKHSQEGIHMKKSTLVALLVVLAAVAGVLGALYVYVLRREKELDEYEQLLFSEDFSDDLADEDILEELEEAEAIADANA